MQVTFKPEKVQYYKNRLPDQETLRQCAERGLVIEFIEPLAGTVDPLGPRPVFVPPLELPPPFAYFQALAGRTEPATVDAVLEWREANRKRYFTAQAEYLHECALWDYRRMKRDQPKAFQAGGSMAGVKEPELQHYLDQFEV